MTATRRGRSVLGVAAFGVLALLAGAGHEACAASATPVVHEIKAGDTLTAIARRYGVSVSALVAANRLPKRPVLIAGRTLKIPVRAIAQPRAIAPPAKPAATKAALTRSPRALRAPSMREPRRSRPAPERMVAPPASLVLGVPEFAFGAPAFWWPVEGGVSSPFGRRRRAWHRGIDIQAEPGAPIVAAAHGVVVASGVEPRYGRVVKIEHENGFMTVYAHNSDNAVAVGDWVVPGQVIGNVGMTGRATGHHLHFEIRHEGRVFNPLYLLPLPPRLATAEVMESDEEDDE